MVSFGIDRVLIGLVVVVDEVVEDVNAIVVAVLVELVVKLVEETVGDCSNYGIQILHIQRTLQIRDAEIRDKVPYLTRNRKLANLLKTLEKSFICVRILIK